MVEIAPAQNQSLARNKFLVFHGGYRSFTAATGVFHGGSEQKVAKYPWIFKNPIAESVPESIEAKDILPVDTPTSGASFPKVDSAVGG